MKVESTFRRIQQEGHTGAIYYGYKFKRRRGDKKTFHFFS